MTKTSHFGPSQQYNASPSLLLQSSLDQGPIHAVLGSRVSMRLPFMLCTDLTDLVNFSLVQSAVLLLLSPPEHRIICAALGSPTQAVLGVHLSYNTDPPTCMFS